MGLNNTLNHNPSLGHHHTGDNHGACNYEFRRVFQPKFDLTGANPMIVANDRGGEEAYNAIAVGPLDTVGAVIIESKTLAQPILVSPSAPFLGKLVAPFTVRPANPFNFPNIPNGTLDLLLYPCPPPSGLPRGRGQLTATAPIQGYAVGAVTIERKRIDVLVFNPTGAPIAPTINAILIGDNGVLFYATYNAPPLAPSGYMGGSITSPGAIGGLPAVGQGILPVTQADIVTVAGAGLTGVIKASDS